jgi:hypothetical protein
MRILDFSATSKHAPARHEYAAQAVFRPLPFDHVPSGIINTNHSIM